MARGVFVAATTLTAAALNDCFDPPRARVRNSANLATTSGTGLLLTFDTETQDVGGMHSTSTNTSRLTVPTGGAGTYLIGCVAEFAANATGSRAVSIRLNGSTIIATERVQASAVAADSTRVGCTTSYPLIAGDYIEVLATQNSGGALNVLAAAEYSPVFWATWVAI